MTVAVIAAHPDDEVLGCGGTIARLADEGHAVAIAILGEGARARADAPDGAVEALTASAADAARVLGAKLAHRLTWPDNRFDTVPMLDLVQSVETVLADLRPEVVFTHNPYCLNVDHRLTAQAVMTATRPGTSSVRAVYAFETPSATEWAFGALGVFVPTLFYTLTLAQIQRKEDALKCYDTEGRRWPHPRSVSKLSAQASTHGGAVAAAFAERFMVLREIR